MVKSVDQKLCVEQEVCYEHHESPVRGTLALFYHRKQRKTITGIRMESLNEI